MSSKKRLRIGIVHENNLKDVIINLGRDFLFLAGCPEDLTAIEMNAMSNSLSGSQSPVCATHS